MPDTPDPIGSEERVSILVSLAELKGQITQALSQTATHGGRLDDHETRLRAVETENATTRGSAASAGRWWGIGAAVVATVIGGFITAQIIG